MEIKCKKILLALKQNPYDAFVLGVAAYFYEALGNNDLAKKYYLKALKTDPENGSIQNDYGVFLCRSKHYRESIRYFLLAAHNINYLHTASAYKNASKCALKIPDKKLSDLYLHEALKNE